MKPKKKHPVAKKKKDLEGKPPPWEGITIAFSLVMLSLLWISSFFPEQRLWGINHWAYFPFWLRTSIIILAFLIFIPQVNRMLQIFLNQTVVAAFRFLVEVRKYPGYVLAITTSLLVFYLFRTRTHLLGDGFQILENINAGTLSVNWSQPLAIWIYLSSFKLFHQIFNLDGTSVYAMISYLSGMIYVIFALRMAVLLGKSSSAKLFVFLILIVMGSSQLFFGYAEHYPVLFCGILIYLFYSLKYLRRKTKIITPVIIFFVLIPLHFSSLYLFPSILFLFFVSGERENLSHIFERKKTWVVSSVLLLLLAGLFLYIREYNWYVFSYFVPLLHGGYTGPNYTLFSPSHLLDFLNQQFLVAPVGLTLFLVFLILRPKFLRAKDRIFQFLLVVSVAQLLFNFLINPGLGASRDWDLFASVSLGYALLALYLFSRIPPDPKVTYLKLNLVILTLLFTLPWILINANPHMSVARFRNLLELDPKKSRNGHFVLASYFEGIGKTEEAERENRKRKEKFLEAELVTQGLYLLEKGDFDQAYQKFSQAVQMAPNSAEARAGLAWYYFKAGDLVRAEDESKKAIQCKPDYRSAYANLGDICIQKGELKKAKDFYQKALRLGVDHIKVLNNMGALYVEFEDLDKAISFYQRAIAKNKDFAESHHGLALVYYQQGKLEESLREVNLVLQIAPTFAPGYHQLGLTYEALGRKKEAVLAYQKFLEMKPNDPEADRIRESIERLKK